MQNVYPSLITASGGPAINQKIYKKNGLFTQAPENQHYGSYGIIFGHIYDAMPKTDTEKATEVANRCPTSPTSVSIRTHDIPWPPNPDKNGSSSLFISRVGGFVPAITGSSWHDCAIVLRPLQAIRECWF